MTEQQKTNREAALYVSSSEKLAFIYLDKTESEKQQRDSESQELKNLVNQEHLDRILRKAGMNINRDSEQKRFLNSYNRMTDYANYTNDLTVGFIRDKENVTYLEANSYFIAMVGGMHIIDESVNQLADMSIKHDFAEVRGDLQVFQNTRACCLYFKFGELCLNDLLTDKNIPLVDCFEFLALANSFARQHDFPKFFNDNKDSVWSKFPLHAMTEASYTAATIMALTQASGEGVKKFALSMGNKIEEKNKESLLSAVKMIKRIERIKKETYSILVNPDSPQFSELGLKLLSFFEENRGIQVLALAAAGLDQGNNFINLYRFSRESLRKGVEVGFYQELNRVLGEIIEETEPFYPGFSVEDLPSILFLEKEEDAPVPEISSFKKTVTEIFSKSSQLNYQLEREDVDWGRMVPAEKIDVKFNSNQPFEFTISLGYLDDSGQVVNLSIDFDLKTNNMDWSVRESPSDPDLEILRQEVTRFTGSALSMVLTQIEQKRKQIAEEKNKLIVTQQLGPKQEKIRPPKEPKPEKEIKKKPLSFLDKAMETIEEQNEKSNLRTEILLPEGPELDYLFRDLTQEDTKRVLKKIREHNFSGAGLIIPLEEGINNGETLYKFRVGNKRVVLIEDGCIDEIKRFIPVRVANRKIIYKKLGI